MMFLRLRRLALFTFALAGSMLTAHAEEPAILAQARNFLATDLALNGVRSIHIQGTLVVTTSADVTKSSQAAVDIVFQKPDQQRMIRTTADVIEKVGLDGYDAWSRVAPVKDPTKFRQNILAPDLIKRLRANTLENLYYYRGLERFGVQVVDQGPATIDGIATQKIAFIHGAALTFTRYFELATGRLVRSESEDGSVTTESGEQIVDGVRFAKVVTTASKKAGGVTETSTLTISAITLNEFFSANEFAVPTLKAR